MIGVQKIGGSKVLRQSDRDVVTVVAAGITLYEALKGEPVKTPFDRMTYDTAMELYGTDKPDLRFELPMVKLTDIFEKTGFGVFKKTVEGGGDIKALVLKGKTLSRKDLDTAVEVAKEMGAGGLIWMRAENDTLQSPIAKYLSDDEKSAMRERLGFENGGLETCHQLLVQHLDDAA